MQIFLVFPLGQDQWASASLYGTLSGPYLVLKSCGATAAGLRLHREFADGFATASCVVPGGPTSGGRVAGPADLRYLGWLRHPRDSPPPSPGASRPPGYIMRRRIRRRIVAALRFFGRILRLPQFGSESRHYVPRFSHSLQWASPTSFFLRRIRSDYVTAHARETHYVRLLT